MIPDDQLQRDLDQLRATTVFRPTPDFATMIGDKLSSRPQHPDRSSIRWRDGARSPLSRPFVVFAVVLLMVLFAVFATMAMPSARESVARWLHIDLPGVRIERVHDDADERRATPSSLGGALVLGTPVSLDEVNALIASPMLAPSTELVGEPSEIWQREGGETISLLYPPSTRLPEIGKTGVGMLVMRVQPHGSDGMLYVKKSIGRDPIVSVSIGGREGWWIVDGQLTIHQPDAVPPAIRGSGNVLIWWEGDDVVWRMESALTREEAIRIALSFAPLRLETRNHGASRAVWVGDGAAGAPSNFPFASLNPEVFHASHRRIARVRVGRLRSWPGGRRRIRAGRTRRATG